MTGGRDTGRVVRPAAVAGWIAAAVLVLLVYVVVVLGGGALLGRTDSPHLGLEVLATAAVAFAVEPARARVERLAARRWRRPDDAPYDVLARFAQEVTGHEPADQMPALIARMLVQGLGVSWAQVWLLVHGRPLLVAAYPPAAAAETEPPRLYPRADGDGDEGAAGGYRSVTVAYAAKPLGVLRVAPRAGRPLTGVEERLFGGLAAQSGLVLHTARLRAELSQRVEELASREQELRRSRAELVVRQDLERRQLERDIHDGAQQQLVALAINLTVAKALLDADRLRAEEIVGEQVAAATEAIHTLSDLSRGLLPDVLTEQGLSAALVTATSSNPVPVRVEATDVGRLPPPMEAAVYFCCLEAVQNATKHAAASRIDVTLRQEAGRLELTVQDDGRGLAPGTGGGTGLANMRDRLVSVAGEVRVRSASGRGTTVRASLPLPVTSGRTR